MQAELAELKRMMTNSSGDQRELFKSIINVMTELERTNRNLKAENKRLKTDLGIK